MPNKERTRRRPTGGHDDDREGRHQPPQEFQPPPPTARGHQRHAERGRDHPYGPPAHYPHPRHPSEYDPRHVQAIHPSQRVDPMQHTMNMDYHHRHGFDPHTAAYPREYGDDVWGEPMGSFNETPPREESSSEEDLKPRATPTAGPFDAHHPQQHRTPHHPEAWYYRGGYPSHPPPPPHHSARPPPQGPSPYGYHPYHMSSYGQWQSPEEHHLPPATRKDPPSSSPTRSPPHTKRRTTNQPYRSPPSHFPSPNSFIGSPNDFSPLFEWSHSQDATPMGSSPPDFFDSMRSPENIRPQQLWQERQEPPLTMSRHVELGGSLTGRSLQDINSMVMQSSPRYHHQYPPHAPPHHPGRRQQQHPSTAYKLPPPHRPKLPPPVSDKKKKPRSCHCKNSRCLKKYCDCFSASAYCTAACKCENCQNVPAHDGVRNRVIAALRTRNPKSFAKSHTCRCVKSSCLKKYCECFSAKKLCGRDCKCMNCENHAGSQKLMDKLRTLKDPRLETIGNLSHDLWRKRPYWGGAYHPPPQPRPEVTPSPIVKSRSRTAPPKEPDERVQPEQGRPGEARRQEAVKHEEQTVDQEPHEDEEEDKEEDEAIPDPSALEQSLDLSAASQLDTSREDEDGDEDDPIANPPEIVLTLADIHRILYDLLENTPLVERICSYL